MSQDSQTTTPRDHEEGATHTPPPPLLHQDEPPSHQPEHFHSPSPSTSHTAAEGLDTQAGNPNKHPTPAPDTDAVLIEMTDGTPPNPNGTNQKANSDQMPPQLTNGTAQATKGTQDEEPDLEPAAAQLGNSKDGLEAHDWQELEERFGARMRECQAREDELGREFREWVEVFKAWASVTEVHEKERASKRLRTRIAYVQQRETKLEEKRQHYIKVVKAFESALALFDV